MAGRQGFMTGGSFGEGSAFGDRVSAEAARVW